jgi:hypothetical protein
LLIVENQKIRERKKGRKKKKKKERKRRKERELVWPVDVWGCGCDSLTHEALRS